MKNLPLIALFIALLLGSCKPEQDPTPQPEPQPEIEFQITSENPVEVEAEGGAIVIEYAITNPKDVITL